MLVKKESDLLLVFVVLIRLKIEKVLLQASVIGVLKRLDLSPLHSGGNPERAVLARQEEQNPPFLVQRLERLLCLDIRLFLNEALRKVKETETHKRQIFLRGGQSAAHLIHHEP